MARYPLLYQVNTRVWLTELGRLLGRPAALDDIPEIAIERWAAAGFDWIWMLSVWRTGAAAQAVSRTRREWRHEFEQTLPDLRDEDIAGSGFAIAGYSVPATLGGDAALARFRERLHRRDLRLMLDFVPNHMAPDHPWVVEHPDYFVAGTEAAAAEAPQNYTRIAGHRTARPPGDTEERVIAYGRDPYFPGWPDTLQLDYGNPATQAAMTGKLLRIARQCDGVRCDMAMLVLPEVFERTWGRRSTPFWPDAIRRVREQVPDFTFLAEGYWDLEWALLQQGFDFVYDKRLYDRLRHGDASSVRDHLHAPLDFQAKLARFMENHDEPRAAEAFAHGPYEAAAIVTYLSPGLRFLHQGQLQGRHTRIPTHLARAPIEPVDTEITGLYERLLPVLHDPVIRNGEWRLLDNARAWPENWTADSILASLWSDRHDRRRLVAVNESAHQSQCFVKLPAIRTDGGAVHFADRMNPVSFDRDESDLEARGLYLDLPPWGYHVFDVQAA